MFTPPPLELNSYHWAKIDHPIKPVNNSEEDLDDATKEREGVFGRRMHHLKENILRKHLENEDLKKITKEEIALIPGFADIIKGKVWQELTQSECKQ